MAFLLIDVQQGHPNTLAMPHRLEDRLGLGPEAQGCLEARVRHSARQPCSDTPIGLVMSAVPAAGASKTTLHLG